MRHQRVPPALPGASGQLRAAPTRKIHRSCPARLAEGSPLPPAPPEPRQRGPRGRARATPSTPGSPGTTRQRARAAAAPSLLPRPAAAAAGTARLPSLPSRDAGPQRRRRCPCGHQQPPPPPGRLRCAEQSRRPRCGVGRKRRLRAVPGSQSRLPGSSPAACC